jgi:hypothetical protein
VCNSQALMGTKKKHFRGCVAAVSVETRHGHRPEGNGSIVRCAGGKLARNRLYVEHDPVSF